MMDEGRKDLISRQQELLTRMKGMGLCPASEHFDRVRRAKSGEGDIRPFDRLFPHAEHLETPCGPCRRVRVEAPIDGVRSREGYLCPATLWGGPPDPRVLADLTNQPEWGSLQEREVVYFDTETTALATGAGTYTFLIGLGWFEGERFVVEQYFMEDYDQEAGLVAAVDQALQGVRALVSYNGTKFDLPLLRARWILQRRRLPDPPLHLDLLAYARRLWRQRLPNCSLGQVEADILDIQRLSDVAGSWVPRIYFDFVRGVRIERMIPVFDHHAQDIFSLGALTSVLVRAWAEPHAKAFDHASDQWGLGCMLLRRGRVTEALKRMESAVLATRDEERAFGMAMRLARVYKRQGKLDEAVALWAARVAQARAGRLEPLVELAKHAEHRLGDFHEALRWTQRAIELLDSEHELRQWIEGSAGQETMALSSKEALALHHRLTRLKRRIQRSAGSA